MDMGSRGNGSCKVFNCGKTPDSLQQGLLSAQFRSIEHIPLGEFSLHQGRKPPSIHNRHMIPNTARITHVTGRVHLLHLEAYLKINTFKWGL